MRTCTVTSRKRENRSCVRLLSLAHINLEEYVNKTRQGILSNISEAEDFVGLSQGLEANVSKLQKPGKIKKALTDDDKETLNEFRVRFLDREMTGAVCEHFEILDSRNISKTNSGNLRTNAGLTMRR